jgi:guanylate kinase
MNAAKEARQQVETGRATGVYIVSAPSGSGKTTLVDRLLHDVPHLHFSISYTTRPPRGPEQHGREYCFLTREQFQAMIAEGKLLEWAEVFGNFYGTAKRFLEEARQQGNDLLLDIDVQGEAQVKEKIPDAVSIFILPPSRAVLEYRLRKRGQDSDSVIARRLDRARSEICGYIRYDYVLINEELEDTVERFRSIVLAERAKRGDLRGMEISPDLLEHLRTLAESCRRERVAERIGPILKSFGGNE